MVHLSEREADLPDAVIAKLLKIAVEDPKTVSLGPGEPDFPLPQPLIEAVKEHAHDSNHYSPPGGRKELKEALVKKLKKDNNITTHPDNIIITCGSQEALLLATACCLDVSEQVIIPNPSFLGYLPTFELFNAFPIPLPIYEEDNWNIDTDALEKLIDKKKTKAILINTPANPTGNVLSKKTLEHLADIAIDNNLYIFSDEAYEKLIYDKTHHSIGALNGMHDHVVTFQTFSKTYAMCGFRVGYAVGPKLLIDAMTKTHIYTTLSAPTLSQHVATRALTLTPAYTQAMVKEYNRRRTFLVKSLNKLGLPTRTPYGAFYTFSNIQHYFNNSFTFAYDLLKRGKVAVVPGREFGVHGEGYIRCSYATSYTNIQEAVQRIARYLDTHGRKR